MQSHSTPLIDPATTAPLKATFPRVRNALVALALLVATAQLASAVPAVTATQNDGELPATRKLVGETINYTTHYQ